MYSHTMKIKITKRWWLRQRWHFTIIAKNGKKLAQSENYNNRKDCLDTIYLLQKELSNSRIVFEEDKRDLD